MTEWHYYDKVYREWVVVVISSPEDFHEFMDNAGYKDMDYIKSQVPAAWCISMTPDNNDVGNTAYILWFGKWNLPSLVHEITHLVHFILDDKGIPFIRENTETVAYYTEFWYNTITKGRRRRPEGIPAKEVRKTRHL